MRRAFYLAAAAVLFAASSSRGAGLTGEYLESRSCEVYTGPCFANAEMDLAGKEAVMAWKVDAGTWNGVALDGLVAALVVSADNTLGTDGVFPSKARRVRSVILVDEKADAKQRAALVDFVKDSARDLTREVARVDAVPIRLENDHLDGRGTFAAGNVARIETRALKGGDCVCTNEVVYYQPLTDVENVSPAYSLTQSYKGPGLGNQWTTNNKRGAFLATFRK
jgi:hypothetical protein